MSESERQQLAQAAVADLVQQIDPGAMVTRFVLLAEVIDTDADRAVWMLTPEDAKAWDVMGLLAFAQAHETNGVQPDED